MFEHLHRRAVGLLEHIGNEHLVGTAGADHRAVEAHHGRQVRRDAVEVVGGQHDREPVGVEVVEQVQHVVAGAHVETRGRLVEEDDRCLGEQGSGEEHPLLLPTRELTDVSPRQTRASRAAPARR